MYDLGLVVTASTISNVGLGILGYLYGLCLDLGSVLGGLSVGATMVISALGSVMGTIGIRVVLGLAPLVGIVGCI